MLGAIILGLLGLNIIVWTLVLILRSERKRP